MVGAAASGRGRPLPKGRRWLVLAPHPDDETLGAGALIAQAARERSLAGVVYLTDGGSSHPVMGAAREALVALRRREACKAVRTLTGRTGMRPMHLDWEDARPAGADSEAYGLARARLIALMRRRHVTALAVTALEEPHCDHAAAARLAYMCARDVGRHVEIFEYAVWSSRPGRRLRPFATAPVAPGRRRAALACHRSQLTGVVGPGFRLPRHARAMPPRDILYRRSAAHAP